MHTPRPETPSPLSRESARGSEGKSQPEGDIQELPAGAQNCRGDDASGANTESFVQGPPKAAGTLGLSVR